MTDATAALNKLQEEMDHADRKHGPLNDRLHAARLIETYADRADNALRSTADPQSFDIAAPALIGTAAIAIRTLIGLGIARLIPARPEQPTAETPAEPTPPEQAPTQ